LIVPYGPLSTQFHDADKPRADASELAWYDARLPRDAGPVLDAMCGSGRLLVPLAQRGLHVHGVDRSASMLEACRAGLGSAGLDAPLFRQNVAELNVPFRYGAVFMAAASFQALADETAARSALARIKAHLVPPGVLLLDLAIPDAALHPPAAPLVEVRAVKLANGARITLRSETLVDSYAHRLSVAMRYEKREPSGTITREDESRMTTWYDEDRIRALLEASSFADVTIEPAPCSNGGGRMFGVRACARR
jgi:SAM-dependent methyltransferase